MSLLETIANGENSGVEFKDERVLAGDLAEEIVAFANGYGGSIYIGVADDGTVLGVSRPDIETWLMNICRENCRPALIPYFEMPELAGKKIAVLHIPKGINKPYQTVQGKYYIRVGSTKRLASKEELLRLFQASSLVHYDVAPVAGSSMADLDIYKLTDYFKRFYQVDLQQEECEKILLNSEILVPLDQHSVCSVGGLLIFGRAPQKYLPQAELSYAYFRGADIGAELLDKKNISGSLTDLVDKTQDLILLNTPVPSTIIGMKREEQIAYPKTVIREALVNAVLHRDYSIYGAKIRVFQFSDRIQFYSPGRLPNSVTVEKMKTTISVPRNPFLLKYMENYRYIDGLGRGIPMIMRQMRQLNAPEPLLIEDGEEFVLTVFRAIF